MRRLAVQGSLAAPAVSSPRYRGVRLIGSSTSNGARCILPVRLYRPITSLGCMRGRLGLTWSTVRWPMATPVRRPECRRTTQPLHSTSATAQVARLPGAKATHCKVVVRRRQLLQRLPQQQARLRRLRRARREALLGRGARRVHIRSPMCVMGLPRQRRTSTCLAVCLTAHG
jgi:hypothetical protein